MRWMSILACSAALLAAAPLSHPQAVPAKKKEPARPAAKVVPPSAPAALLPDAFAGWVAATPPRIISPIPAQADPANTAALTEYDFSDGSRASYKRSGETLARAPLRFRDASGAYGAYSFYRQNGWPKEEIGSGCNLRQEPRALLAG